MHTLLLKAMGAGAGIILASSAGVRGATLYQNTTTPTGQVLNFPNNQEIGQEIWLGTGATPMYLTNFSFEYYDPFNSVNWPGPPGNQQYIQAEVRLYLNNGPVFNGYATPGARFYDSGHFEVPTTWAVSGTSTATIDFQLSDLQSGNLLDLPSSFILPSNFTFTVTFSGLSGADSVGLPDFEPPTIGANYGDYWYDVSGNWELFSKAGGAVGSEGE